MPTMVRERESHASRLFIEVTPGIRRALEMLAEASIDLLNEIDAPLDGLEVDPDFELLAEDDENGGDAEDLREDDEDTHDAEPEEGDSDLGWPEAIGVCLSGPGWYEDEDFVAPETSAGLGPAMCGNPEVDAALRARFRTCRAGGRPSQSAHDEMRRLRSELARLAPRRRRQRARRG